MPFTQITTTNIANGAVTFAQTATGAFTLTPIITTIQIADSSYNVLDDTAANTTGGYVVITGTNFGSNSQVIIGTTNATSTTYVNSTTIRAQVPALAAATYNVYVVDNTTGGTAIKLSGLTYSSFPAWSTGSTLSNQNSGTYFGVNLSATSDSNITYANTTVLPTGTSLLANGYFSGTITNSNQTIYSFTVKATDVELQDASRTFSVTVTVIPQGKLYTWGYNGIAALGTNDLINRSSPVQLGTDTTWSIISSVGWGGIHSAIKLDGTLWTWGKGDMGGLGNNTSVNRSSPAQVGALSNWAQLATGGKGTGVFTFAIKTDGTLWAIGGKNTGGSLGLNQVIPAYRSSPVQIGAGTNWSMISTSGYSVIATKTDGTLWTWGSNTQGELGLNDRVYRSSPVQVGSGTTWSSVTAHDYSPMATKTDGTLWTWGNNNNGQLGLNDRVYRSSPTQVGSGTTWSIVEGGASGFNVAIKTDGTLWVWGNNAQGNLGLNDLINRSSPVQVGSGTTWSSTSNKICASDSSMYGIKSDGSLWVWGYNVYGQLGTNDRVGCSSPIQLGSGTSWVSASSGGYSVMALSST